MEFFERANEAGIARERARPDVEDLHDRHAARHGTVDEGLLTVEIRGEIVFTPVRALAKRLLGIDDEQGGTGGVGSLALRHEGLSVRWEPMAPSYGVP